MKALLILLLSSVAWAQGIQYNGVALGVNTNSHAAPTVSAISPAVSGAGGGTVVTITGTNFISGATATVAGVSCGTLSVVSSTSITCTTGAMTATGAQTASVAVTTSGGTGTLSNAFDVEPASSTTYVNQLFEPAQIALSATEGTATTGGVPLTAADNITNCIVPGIQSSVFKTGTSALQAGGNTGNGNTACGGSWLMWGMANPEGQPMGNVQPPNPAAANANGVFIHFYIAVNQTQLDNANNHQGGSCVGTDCSNMKVGAQRANPSPDFVTNFNWIVFGMGFVYQCNNGQQDCITYQIDSGLHFPNAPLFDLHMVADTFHEIECQFIRNTGTNQGKVTCWADGKRWFSYGPANDVGSSDLTTHMEFQLGSYTNQTGTPAHGTQDIVYIDDFVVADGWIPWGS